MNKNKVILKYCPNFYKIINFEYLENDYITERLINIYRDFIFNVDTTSEAKIKQAVELDSVLAKYIDDYLFRKEMKYELVQLRIRKDEDNMVEAIVSNIVKIFNRYQEGFTRKIYISKWI